MATSYTPPFDDPGEVREGFLCPLCLKDLQSFQQLQSHYEEHSSEDRDVKGQLKSKCSNSDFYVCNTHIFAYYIQILAVTLWK